MSKWTGHDGEWEIESNDGIGYVCFVGFDGVGNKMFDASALRKTEAGITQLRVSPYGLPFASLAEAKRAVTAAMARE